MKNIINKNIAALLVLSAAALPLTTQAATEATINITAKVMDVMDLTVSSDAVEFLGDMQAQDVKITTSNNKPAKITVSTTSETADNILSLVEKDDAALTLPVSVTIAGDTAAAFDSSHVMAHNLSGLSTDAVTTLHLAPQKDTHQNAGEYKGSLTVKLEAL